MKKVMAVIVLGICIAVRGGGEVSGDMNKNFLDNIAEIIEVDSPCSTKYVLQLRDRYGIGITQTDNSCEAYRYIPRKEGTGYKLESLGRPEEYFNNIDSWVQGKKHIELGDIHDVVDRHSAKTFCASLKNADTLTCSENDGVFHSTLVTQEVSIHLKDPQKYFGLIQEWLEKTKDMEKETD